MRKVFAFIFILFTINILHGQIENDFRNALQSISSDSLRKTVTDLQNFGTRYCLRDGGNREVADYIAQRLENYGVSTVIDSFYVEDYFWLSGDYQSWFYNVKGVFSPATPSDSVVIIGAHLDAIATNDSYELLPLCPGADDNASGVAVMIEMARIIHQYNFLPKHIINFMAFDAEEIGLVGAYHDAQARVANHEKVVVFLNNDMVSYQPDDDWKVTLHWYDNAQDIMQKAVDICENYTNIAPVILTGEDNDMRQYSDSWAYAQSNIKSIFAIENTFSAYYHTENDSVQWNNYDYHADIARYNFAMLFQYAFADLGTLSLNDYATATSAIQAYPNPANDQITFQYNLSEQSDIHAVICDMTGKTVWENRTVYPVGLHHLTINSADLSNGIYFCHFTTNQQKQTIKIIVSH